MTNDEIECRIDVLSPKQGDMLVVSVAHGLTAQQVAAIKKQVEHLAPTGVRIAVLDKALSLTLVEAPTLEQYISEQLDRVPHSRDDDPRFVQGNGR